MDRLTLKLREAIYFTRTCDDSVQRLQSQLAEAQKQLIKAQGAQNALSELFLEDSNLDLQKAWDSNYKNLAEDPKEDSPSCIDEEDGQ